MTTLWQTGTTIARRMRVKGAGLDPTLTQLRVASLLNATDMQPAGLAPSAIVCIRTLRTSRHVPLSLQHGGVRPPHAWEQSFNASLEEIVRHAVYPIFGPVPINSEAIIFNDTAELLACMAADWCEGLLPTRWWWKSLFKTSDVISQLFPTWLDAPAYAPAALQHLATRNLVIPFVRSLSNDNARLLLQKILHTFSLPALYQALLEPDVGATFMAPVAGDGSFDNVDNPHNGRDQSGPYDDHSHSTMLSKSITAPWQHIVPEAGRNELRPYRNQQCLLGIGLMLHRAPTTVRTAAFAESIQNWRNVTYTINTDDKMVGAQFMAPVVTALNPAEISIADNGRHTSHPEDTTNDHMVRAQFIAPLASDGFSDNVDDLRDGRHTSGPYDVTIQQGAPIHSQDIISDTPINPQQITVSPPDAQSIETPLEIHIDTAFGGLFYLINLALFLNLYSDFTTPMKPGIELPIWDFIALLGQQLLGDTIKQDPIWPLLAQLVERDEHDEPEKDFTPLDGWYIPVAWLETLSMEMIKQFEMNVDDTGKRAPARGCPYNDTTVSSCHCRGIPLRVPCCPFTMVSYIYTRLQLALGLDSQEQVAPLLCVHEAHVRVTATHLDVFFSLNTLPIEIRLAGLDRNPGWVPATGRFIAFHFS